MSDLIVFGGMAICVLYALYCAIHQTIDRALDKVLAELKGEDRG
jgi:hypothetical protein